MYTIKSINIKMHAINAGAATYIRIFEYVLLTVGLIFKAKFDTSLQKQIVIFTV